MIREGKFGPYEAICLTSIAITSKVFFTSPSQLASIVGTAGWYTTLLSGLTAMIGFAFICLLLKQHEGKDFTSIFKIVYGRYIGSIVSGIFAVFFMTVTAIGLREFTDVLKIYALPLTQLSIILTIFIICVMVLCFSGLESIARFSKLFAYILLTGLLIVLFMSVQNYEFHYIFPIFGYGIDSVITNGIIRSSVYGEVVILAFLARSLQGTAHIKKAGYLSIIISAILISLSLLAYTLAFPYHVASEMTSAMYELSAIIDYGRFIQRLEPIFFFVWNISTFVFITIYFYTFTSIFCKMFGIQDKRPVVIVSAVILFCIALIPEGIGSVAVIYVRISRECGGIVFYALPLITLIISSLKMIRSKVRNE